MPETKKKKRGRPKEDVAKKANLGAVRALAETGKTDKEIAEIMSVTEQTINAWKSDPAFLLALKKGKAVADGMVEQSLFNRAMGYSVQERHELTMSDGRQRIEVVTKYIAPDVTAQIFWLKNRKHEDWRDRKEVTGADGGAINMIFENVVGSK